MWQVGDWCIFDLHIVQILELRDEDGTWDQVSDGSFTTSGKLQDRFRQLTLANKAIMESFRYYYEQLKNIPGNQGFNYPRISTYFEELSRKAIDGEPEEAFTEARTFLNEAAEHKPLIQGINLFRPN
jgi:hypothetical protein